MHVVDIEVARRVMEVHSEEAAGAEVARINTDVRIMDEEKVKVEAEEAEGVAVEKNDKHVWREGVAKEKMMLFLSKWS